MRQTNLLAHALGINRDSFYPVRTSDWGLQSKRKAPRPRRSAHFRQI